jgi:hypothetical protein
MAIKGKTEELLVKPPKTCEKKMQELTDSIKRPNLRIMSRGASKRNVQYIQQNNKRKLPNCREKYVHSRTGNFQNTEQT